MTKKKSTSQIDNITKIKKVISLLNLEIGNLTALAEKLDNDYFVFGIAKEYTKEASYISNELARFWPMQPHFHEMFQYIEKSKECLTELNKILEKIKEKNNDTNS